MKHVTVCYTKNAPLILFMIQMWKQIFNIHKKVVYVSQQKHNFYPMRNYLLQLMTLDKNSVGKQVSRLCSE